jgi:tRNA(adenine34) deaminase
MVPEFEDSDGAAVSREARTFWGGQWRGKTLMAIGAEDPVLGPPVMQKLKGLIQDCGDAILLEGAAHFVPERGEPVALAAVRFFSA